MFCSLSTSLKLYLCNFWHILITALRGSWLSVEVVGLSLLSEVVLRGLLKVVGIGLEWATASDGFTESSEKSPISGVSSVSGWIFVVILGRVGNLSIVSPIVGCGVCCEEAFFSLFVVGILFTGVSLMIVRDGGRCGWWFVVESVATFGSGICENGVSCAVVGGLEFLVGYFCCVSIFLY